MKRSLGIVLLLISLTLGFTSCTEKHEYFDTDPLLKIVVSERNGYLVENALVLLYDNEQDWVDGRDRRYGWTNSQGSIIFDGLHEQVYYYEVRKGVFHTIRGRTNHALQRGKLLVVPVTLY